jgi:hypothetical protein
MATVQRLHAVISGGVFFHAILQIVNMHVLITKNKKFLFYFLQMSEVSFRKRSLSLSNEFEKLLVCMIYTSGDVSYYEREYDSIVDLAKVGSMTCSEANSHIGLFDKDGLSKQWSEVKNSTAFYRIQQEYKCFVFVLHDGYE